MKRAILFAPLARLDFEDAAAWCEEQRAGLGDEFRIAVNAALQRVLKSPHRFRLVSPSTHKIALNRFRNYSLYYSVEPEAIHVTAVFHGSRNPEELRGRLK
jgi:plasmid stabilization system protein ParE